MTGTVPNDQAVRDAAAQDLDRTLFVEAGAGSGKTTMLVDRVVALITSGRARMEQIAAITFTESAAAELRDRLAQEFETRAHDRADERAHAAALALDAAAVNTLHGFARTILAEQPFGAGLPPLFDVADESSDQVTFDERWDRFRVALLEEPADEELMVRALSCGLTWTGLREAALQCHRNWDLIEGVSVTIPPRPLIEADVLLGHLQHALDGAAACTDTDDTLAVLLETVADARTALRSATDEIDLLQTLTGFAPFGRRGRGQKDNGPGDGKDAVGSWLRLAEEERRRLVDGTAQWVVQRLVSRLVAFTMEGVRERRASGHLVFHDLLVLARNLVRDNPAARAELHRRFTHVLIDEFQDTDPLQAELALYLAAGPGADFDREWVDLPVPARRLFFVGDPKQSIYRFRRADIGLFMKVRDHVVTSSLQLTTNFRSRPGIVEWVNAVFAGMFEDGVPGMQPGYVPLRAHRHPGLPNRSGAAPVIVLGHAAMEGGADAVREVQAREVATAIATMHAEEWLLGDGEEARPLRFGDVALLIRTRTGLEILENALLEADVPYRLESSSLVYESAEVQQLLAILRAIDDPADTVSVLAALRSPAFGCGDDDLYRHHLEGGRWDRRARGAADTPVAQALEELASHHAGRWWQSVSALVGRVVADRRLMALALSHRRPRESWRRIRFLLDQARLFDETNGGDLRAFLRWVGHQAEDGARVTEAIVPESDDDAVRVVTVHGSKGLEYPVVVLMGLQKKDNHHKAPLIFSRAGPQFHFTKHLETAGYQVAAEHEAAMERFEQQRLLYVAATRAQELLLVSLHRDTKQTATLAAQLAEQCDRQPGLWSDGSALCAGLPRARPHLPGDTSEPDGPELRRAFTAGRGRLLERMVRPMTVGATGVRGLARDDAVDGPVEEPLERSALVHRRGRAGTAVGRAVHAVLQVIDLQTGAGLEALAHAQAVAEGVPGRERDVCRSVQAALHSDLVRQAVDSGRLWREMFVGVPVGQRVLEGFIDLLFESPEGLAIVDYKTDHLAQADAAAEVAGRYRLQGASYALAVEQALGRPVASCTFLFLAPSGAVAERLPDLSAAVTEARDLLSQPRHEEAHI